MIKDEIKEKVLKIMELALLLNLTETEYEITGNKPTVFVNFSGHVCMLDIRVYFKGWEAGAAPDVQKIVYLDGHTAENELNEVIDTLEKLYEEESQKWTSL